MERIGLTVLDSHSCCVETELLWNFIIGNGIPSNNVTITVYLVDWACSNRMGRMDEKVWAHRAVPLPFSSHEIQYSMT